MENLNLSDKEHVKLLIKSEIRDNMGKDLILSISCWSKTGGVLR